KFQLPSRLERSLWFSLSLDISIICFIISCGFGCPVAAAGWAGFGAAAVAGDVAGVCANEGGAVSAANRTAVNDINVFIATSCQRLATSDKSEKREQTFAQPILRHEIWKHDDLDASWRRIRIFWLKRAVVYSGTKSRTV